MAGRSKRKIIDLGGRQKLVVASSEEMKEVKAGSVDVAVTSPPYNIGKTYRGDDGKVHRDNLPRGKYLDLLERVFAQVHKALAADGLFFLNLGETSRTQGLAEKVVQRAVRAGFKRVQTVIWVKSIFGKGHYSPSGGRRRLNHLWEYIYILAKGKEYRFDPLAIGVPYADKSNVGRYAEKDLRDPGNVWFIPYRVTTGHTRKKGHEAVFPVELPWRCIKLVPGARLVLDPFAGTCSTLAAARSLGLRGIGYDPYPPLAVIRRKMEEPVLVEPEPVLPELEKGVAALFSLLARLQGTGLHREVRRAWEGLPREARERLERLGGPLGFDFLAGDA